MLIVHGWIFDTVFEIVYRNTTQYQFLKAVFRK